MSLVGSGANIVYERNPATGRLRPVWSAGNFAFGDDMSEVVMSLLVEGEGWATAGRRAGPSLLDVKADTSDAPSALQAYAEQRLDLALRDGRLRSATVTVERVRRGALSVSVQYVTRAGRSGAVLFDVPALGGF